MRILFVCTGNTCRSPMCEAYFNHLCRLAGRDDLSAVSAGVWAGGGEPASAAAAEVMARHGIRLEHFRNRSLTPELIDEADLVVTMTAGHARMVEKMSPAAAAKIRLLLEFADRPEADVADPFGGDIEIYMTCFGEMKTALDNLFLELGRKND